MEKATQLASRMTPIAFSAGVEMVFAVLAGATGISIAATMQTTGTNMFIWSWSEAERCQRQSAMRERVEVAFV